MNGHLLLDRALLFALKGDFRSAEAAIPSILSLHPVKDLYYHHAAYDIACIYALEGKSVEAVRWLREAAATGFRCYPLFEHDALFEPHQTSARIHPIYGGDESAVRQVQARVFIGVVSNFESRVWPDSRPREQSDRQHLGLLKALNRNNGGPDTSRRCRSAATGLSARRTRRRVSGRN